MAGHIAMMGSLPPMTPASDPLSRFCASSIGKKILVALSGLALVLFVLAHMIGNLLIFAGPDAINEYGHFLRTAGHGMALWGARAGMLAVILVHVIFTVQLTRANKAARKDGYGKKKDQEATISSRFMIFSGLTLLAFIVYHLLHFTVRVGNDYNTYVTTLDGHEVHNVYKMVIAGFSWWPASLFYIVAMVLLCSHLSHGVSSMFQTLGLATAKTWPFIKRLGQGYALLILIGNCSIPIAILLGYGR